MSGKHIRIPVWSLAVVVCGSLAFAALAIPARQSSGVPDLRVALPPGTASAGIYLTEMNAETASLFGIRNRPGAVVTRVQCGDLERGDLITTINGESISSVQDLVARFETAAAGAPLNLMVTRSGSQILLTVNRPSSRDSTVLLQNLNALPAPALPSPIQLNAVPFGVSQLNLDLTMNVIRGVQLVNLTANIAQQLGLSFVTTGVLVSAVSIDTPAALAGLRPNDVIVEVNSSPVFSVAEFQKAVGAGLSPIALRINRRGVLLFLTIQEP